MRNEIDADDSVRDLLELGVPWSADLAALFGLFWERHAYLTQLPTVTNPHFSGSLAIGGADADLIVDGRLFEVKTTVEASLRRDWVRQLIGYLLLDWADVFGISSVGFYMSRHGVFHEWPAPEFLELVASEDMGSIVELRDEFKSIVLERAIVRRRRTR